MGIQAPYIEDNIDSIWRRVARHGMKIEPAMAESIFRDIEHALSSRLGDKGRIEYPYSVYI